MTCMEMSEQFTGSGAQDKIEISKKPIRSNIDLLLFKSK